MIVDYVEPNTNRCWQTGRKKFKCRVCGGVRFRWEGVVKPKRRCVHCYTKLTKKSNLKRRIARMVLSTKSSKYVCVVCG